MLFRSGSGTFTQKSRDKVVSRREDYYSKSIISREEQNELEGMQNGGIEDARVVGVQRNDMRDTLSKQIYSHTTGGKNQEILDDPTTIEHIRMDFIRKGKEEMAKVDFTQENVGPQLSVFRGNPPWLVNYMALLKHVANRKGDLYDKLVDGVDASGGKTMATYAGVATSISDKIAVSIHGDLALNDVMKDMSLIFEGNTSATPKVKEEFVNNF